MGEVGAGGAVAVPVEDVISIDHRRNFVADRIVLTRSCRRSSTCRLCWICC